MKKFISMVMAAAMVVTMVPATAFAAGESTFKTVDKVEITEKEADAATEDGDDIVVTDFGTAQLQIKIKDVDTTQWAPDDFEVELKFDGAEFTGANPITAAQVAVYRAQDNGSTTNILSDVSFSAVEKGDDKITITLTEGEQDFNEGDIVRIDLTGLYLTKSKVGHEATVKVVDGDLGTSDALVFATIMDKGIDVDVDDTVDVAEEEVAPLEVVTIEPAVGDDFSEIIDDDDKVTLKLSKGFEFANNNTDKFTFTYYLNGDATGKVFTGDATYVDENEIEVDGVGSWFTEADEVVIEGLLIDAVSAKAGDVATLTVKVGDCDSVKVEVATVVDHKVVMSVDEDEDVPVYYSGVNVANDGLTVDDDHESLEVTIEETFAGAWSMHKDFTLSLPEGVWVTAVDAEDENQTFTGVNLNTAFRDAYIEGDHENFEFEKRTFVETDPEDGEDSEHKMTFVLTLVADPGFVGDVVLTLEGDAFDEAQEVTIAKFVAPLTVKAEQNDLKIDYRYTEVGTDIVVTEAEAGLWDTNLNIGFAVDRGDMINFEDDATFTVNEGSDMEVDDFTMEEIGVMGFVVEEESDEEAAVVTISDIELFMQRNIPAGAYDLELFYGDLTWDEDGNGFVVDNNYDSIVLLGQTTCGHDDCDADNGGANVEDICDYETVVKEGWINVVTAGREADDASFTTKVVVPVGESYIVAGETQVALDVPAYVNAAGYTMLPVRAVAVALGINTQNVLWDQATKTVTILYGQRIITMQVGAKVVYVNGSAIPASASVEIVDGRTFLPMRDLATALGVTDITWDAATKTATLNGNA